MANKGGTITQKELITKDALQWGTAYGAEVDKAIAKNAEFVSGLKEMATIYGQLKGVKTEASYVKIKEKEIKVNRAVVSSYKEQNAQVSALVKTKAQLLNAESKEAKKLAELRLTKQKVNRELKEEAILSNKLVGAYQKLNLQRTQAKKRLQDLIAQGYKPQNAELRKAQTEFNKYDAKVKKADRATRDFHKNVGNYSSAFGKAGLALRQFSSALGLAGGLYAFVAVLRNTIKRIREFDKTMVALTAILGATRSEVQGLEQEITRVAGASIKTSNEVAKLASKLATLGKTKTEIIQLLEPVNNLSIGLEATSDEAGELLIQTLNAFGESASEAQRYADVIANMRLSTALDFQRIRDAMSYIAPVAKTAGLSIENVGAMLGTLVDGGEKAEKAGRLLRTSLLKLAKEGLSLEDALDRINQAQARGVTSLELLTIAGDLFGKQSASLGIILANNREKVAKLTAEYEKSKGSLDELVNKQLESLDAKLKILDSAWEKMILNIENGEGSVSSFFKTFITGTTNAIDSITNLNTISQGFFEFWHNAWRLTQAGGASMVAHEAEMIRYEEKRKTLIVDLIALEKKYNKTIGLRISDEVLNLKYKKATVAQVESEILAYEKLLAVKKEGDNKDGDKDTDTSKRIKAEGIEIKKRNDLLEGTVAWYEKLIAQLEKEAKTKAQGTQAWKEYQLQIQRAKDVLAQIKGIDISSDLTTDIPLAVLEQNTKDHYAAIAEASKLSWEEQIEFASEAIGEISNLVNTMFDGRIMRIDEEIQRTEDKYSHLMTLADEDSIQQNLLEEERYRKTQVLEKKKREEQARQAKYAKAFSVMEIGLNTASAIIKMLADPGGTKGVALSIMAGITGAIQLATALATPIPKYAKGTKGTKKDEIAWIGEKGAEKVTTPSGQTYLSPNKATLAYLEKGTKVTPHRETMEQLTKASILTSIDKEAQRMHGAKQVFDMNLEKLNGKLTKEIQDGMKKGFRNVKHNIIINQNFGHIQYKNKNLQF